MWLPMNPDFYCIERKEKMKRTLAVVLALLLALSMVSVFANAEETTTAAPEPVAEEPKSTYAIYGTPVIDAEKDLLWETAQINKVEKVYLDNGLTEPCAAQFRLAYDDKYLYYYAEVLDNTMPPEETGAEWEMQSNSWINKEGVGLAFTPDGDKSVTTGRVKPTFWFIVRAWGTVANWDQCGQNVFVTEDEGAVMADQNDFEKHPMANRMYAVKRTANPDGTLNGYIVEGKVNLNARMEESGKSPINMAPGTEIGFEFMVNNSNYLLLSNSRDYCIAWADITLQAYNNNSLKGTVIFAEQSKKFTNTAEDEKLVIPSAAEDTTVEEEQTTADPSATTAAPAVTTQPEVTTKSGPKSYTTPVEGEQTQAPETQKTEEKSGCGSVAAIGVAMIVTVLGAAYVSKKH